MARTHYDIWADRYRPLKNHLDANASGDGCMFETYGKELDHVLSVANTEPAKVWTIVEGDNGKLYVAPGYLLVNRFGYFVTEQPFDEADPKQARYASRPVLYA